MTRLFSFIIMIATFIFITIPTEFFHMIFRCVSFFASGIMTAIGWPVYMLFDTVDYVNNKVWENHYNKLVPVVIENPNRVNEDLHRQAHNDPIH